MRTIPYKEDLTIEFKSDLKRYPDNDLIDEIVGMANTKGGTLYLGVEDDGEITGIRKIRHISKSRSSSKKKNCTSIVVENTRSTKYWTEKYKAKGKFICGILSHSLEI